MDKKVKGTYKLNGKYAARIQRDNGTVHLGTFETEELAAEVYDAACLVFAKPLSAYNDPHRLIDMGLLMKVLILLRDKKVLEQSDLEAVVNRYIILADTAQMLEKIQNGSYPQEQ